MCYAIKESCKGWLSAGRDEITHPKSLAEAPFRCSLSPYLPCPSSPEMRQKQRRHRGLEKKEDKTNAGFHTEDPFRSPPPRRKDVYCRLHTVSLCPQPSFIPQLLLYSQLKHDILTHAAHNNQQSRRGRAAPTRPLCLGTTQLLGYSARVPTCPPEKLPRTELPRRRKYHPDLPERSA